MAIEKYERKEQIDTRTGRVDYSAPEIADIGGVFRQTGRSLLSTAAPILERKRTTEGQIDAADAPLTKDPNGNIMRANPIPGGGTVYADAFRQAASTLYKGRLISDYDTQMTNIVNAHRNDPATAMAKIQAHTQAVLETVPPDIRADIEPDLLRESSQKFNWLTTTKMNEDRTAQLAGLKVDYDAQEKNWLVQRGAAAARGDYKLVAELDATFKAFADPNRKARMDLGALSWEGVSGEIAGAGAETFLMDLEMTAMQSKEYITGRARELYDDTDQLKLMIQWKTGDETLGEGRVLGMNYKQYLDFLKTPRAVDEMAAYASETITNINNAAADDAAAGAAAATALKDQEILDRVRVDGELAFQNKDFRDQWNAAIYRDMAAKGMTITEVMNFPGSKENPISGIEYMKGHVAVSGYLPEALSKWIYGATRGTNIHKVVEFVDNMLGARSPKTGMYTGVMAWKQIDGETRAFISRYRELADAGVSTDVRRDMVEAMIKDKDKRDVTTVHQAFDKNDSKNGTKLYVEARDKYVLALFGVPYTHIPISMRKMIDDDSQAFLHIYGQDPRNAVKAAIEGVATVWTPDSIGVQGYIPTELAGLGLTDSQLDKAFGNWVEGKGHVFGGAGFTTFTRDGLPRARIELADDSQLLRGAGNYIVRHYDYEGTQIYPTRHINIDDVLVKHFGGAAALEEKMQTARRAEAKTKRDKSRDAIERASKLPLKIPAMQGRNY